MFSRSMFISMISLLLLTFSANAFAHCQIPCGIYDDQTRFTLLEEHIATIEKAISQLGELSKAAPVNYNQVVRWVSNKDEHAGQFSEIITAYFLAQRIKPADPKDQAASDKYIKELKLLHEMIVYAMKAKQSTDLENVTKLKVLTADFKASYMGANAEHKH